MERPDPKSISAPRQKSCDACVKGKRRCDKRHPVCSRCEEKKIRCIYAKRTYAEAFYDFDSTELDASWAGFTPLSLSNDFGDNPISPSITPSSGLDATQLPALDKFLESILTFPENQAMPSSDIQPLHKGGESTAQRQEEEQELSNFDYAPMADLCVCNLLEET
jgi:hypothetical protein